LLEPKISLGLYSKTSHNLIWSLLLS